MATLIGNYKKIKDFIDSFFDSGPRDVRLNLLEARVVAVGINKKGTNLASYVAIEDEAWFHVETIVDKTGSDEIFGCFGETDFALVSDSGDGFSKSSNRTKHTFLFKVPVQYYKPTGRFWISCNFDEVVSNSLNIDLPPLPNE